MIGLLVVAGLAVQVASSAPRRPQAVVIADVQSVEPVRAPPCTNSDTNICILGVPDVGHATIRRFLIGKGATGRMSFVAGAPVGLKAGRQALLMDWTGGNWFVVGASATAKPCFGNTLVDPATAADPRFRRVGDDYCLIIQR